MLKIGLENIKCLAHHGVLDAERVNGNNFIVNIYVWYKTKNEFESDQLQETYDYSLLSNIVQEEMSVSVYLLENVAFRIINKVKATDKKVKKVYVKIQKPNPPLKGDIQYSFVEIKKKVNR